jgi:hypothetical protein
VEDPLVLYLLIRSGFKNLSKKMKKNANAPNPVPFAINSIEVAINPIEFMTNSIEFAMTSIDFMTDPIESATAEIPFTTFPMADEANPTPFVMDSIGFMANSTPFATVQTSDSPDAARDLKLLADFVADVAV